MKIKVDFMAGILLFLVSIITLLFPIFNINNVDITLKFIFIAYAIINLIRFIITRKTKDFEGLYTSLVSTVLFISLFFIKVTDFSLALALILFIFVVFISFIRLKKADYYHDRKDKTWILEITTLIVFVICGLLISLSLLLVKDANLVLIGFLFFINGFIEIIDPIVNYIKKQSK